MTDACVCWRAERRVDRHVCAERHNAAGKGECVQPSAVGGGDCRPGIGTCTDRQPSLAELTAWSSGANLWPAWKNQPLAHTVVVQPLCLTALCREAVSSREQISARGKEDFLIISGGFLCRGKHKGRRVAGEPRGSSEYLSALRMTRSGAFQWLTTPIQRSR